VSRVSAPKAPRISEAAISRSIMDYLAAEHIFAVRMNSGMRIGEHKGKKWAIHMNAPGTADILAFPRLSETLSGMIVLNPRVLWIEVKAADGKQSDLQKSFQAQVEAEGHRYVIVRSIEDVKGAIV
jgi:hypothetical protein